MFMNSLQKRKKGFTIIEALIGVSILMFAMIGPLLLVYRTSQSASDLRDHTVAAYLALEGMEAIRSIRDGRTLLNPRFLTVSNMDWLGPLRQCVGAWCTIDVNTGLALPTVTLCTGACQPLRVSRTAQYGYNYDSSNPASPFTRSVTLDEAPSILHSHATATISVSWKNKLGQDRSINYEYHIFKW